MKKYLVLFAAFLTLSACGSDQSYHLPDSNPDQDSEVSDPEPAPEDPQDPEPMPEPDPEPNPIPYPDLPLDNPNQNDKPAPDPIDSDFFIDEVVSYQPGVNSPFKADDFPEAKVLGAPQGSGLAMGNTSDVLPLGKGGEIILKSETAILNGPGADFIVFENAFYVNGDPQNKPFAEQGEVSVSQDGVKFFKFSCNPQSFAGCAGIHPVLANANKNNIDPTDPAKAGGDAFDLENLGLDWVSYIRIRDVSSAAGCGQSCYNGFDLDAISIRYQ